MKTFLVILFMTTACGQDPLLQALANKDQDERTSRIISVTNEAEQEISVCPYYGDDCFFTVPSGQTISGTVKYQRFTGDEDDADIGISLRRKDNRKVFQTENWETLLSGEHREVRWAGNFSGVHVFSASSELTDALAVQYSTPYYRYSRSTINNISRSLNNIEPLWKISENYGTNLQITAPVEDTVLYIGTQSGAGPDNSVGGGDTFKKDGWHYQRLSEVLTDRMFSNYSGARAFLCRTGGCFEQSGHSD